MRKFSIPLVWVRALPAVLLMIAVGVWNWERERRLISEEKAAVHLERLFRAEEQIQTLTTDLARQKEESKQKEERLTAMEEEHKSLLEQLAQRDEHIRRLLAEMIRVLSGNEATAPPSLAEAHGVVEGAPAELITMTQESLSRQSAAKAMPLRPMPPAPAGLAQTEIETRNISVEAAGESQHWFEGEVLSVNPAKKFVVINRGAEDGLENGMGIWIYEQGRRLGRLEVESTFKKIASATVVEGDAERLRSGSSYNIRLVARP